MKRFLLFALFALSICFSLIVNAQGGGGNNNTCVVDKVGIQITNSVASGAGCTVTANLYFVAEERNPGQKFFTVHLWEQGRRPAGLNFSQPLPAAALNAALRNIVIEDLGTGNNPNWQLSRVYNGRGDNPAININGATLTVYRIRENEPIPPGLEDFEDFNFFIISNVVFTTTAACTNLNLVADVTGSNANFNQNMQCFNTGLQVFNCQTPQQNYTPTLSGAIVCSTPNTFTISASNAGGCFPYYVTYSVVADLNNNGVVDAGEPTVGGGPNQDYFILFPGESETKAPRALPANVVGDDLIITNIRTATADPAGVLEDDLTNVVITSDCAEAPLPVTFKSFNAARNQQNRQKVELSWVTAQEQNNQGFHVQRKVGSSWENVAFVFSAAENGNSNEALTYSFVDNNTSNGVSQYRLLQVDLDGRSAYSDVKSIRGLALQSGVVVYPNPAVSGKASVLFPDVATTRDVLISDVSGRIVKQYREVAENTLSIEGLNSGFYTIRVVDRKTNSVEVAKLVVR